MQPIHILEKAIYTLNFYLPNRWLYHSLQGKSIFIRPNGRSSSPQRLRHSHNIEQDTQLWVKRNETGSLHVPRTNSDLPKTVSSEPVNITRFRGTTISLHCNANAGIISLHIYYRTMSFLFYRHAHTETDTPGIAHRTFLSAGRTAVLNGRQHTQPFIYS